MEDLQTKYAQLCSILGEKTAIKMRLELEMASLVTQITDVQKAHALTKEVPSATS